MCQICDTNLQNGVGLADWVLFNFAGIEHDQYLKLRNKKENKPEWFWGQHKFKHTCCFCSSTWSIQVPTTQ
jgi:hypothetical protein